LPNWITTVLTKLYMFYSKFQLLIMTLVIIGILELVVSYDFMMAMFAVPEAAPVILTILLAIGLYKLWQRRRARQAQLNAKQDAKPEHKQP